MRAAAVNISSGLKSVPGAAWRGAMETPGALKRCVMTTPAAVFAAPAAIRARASRFWVLCDLRTMLQPHAHDADLLRLIRGSDLEAGNEAFTIGQATEQLQNLSTLISGSAEIQPKFKRQALKEIATIQQAMHPLQHGTSPSVRAFKAIVNLINLWPSIVPSPFIANQAKTFAYTVAASSKAVVGVAGNSLRSTADGWPFPLGGGEMGHHSNEVHFYPALLNLVYGFVYGAKRFGDEPTRHRAEAIEHNKAFHGGVAVACGAILIAPFVWSHLQRAAGKASDFALRGIAAGVSQFGQRGVVAADGMREALTPGHVDDIVRAELTRVFREFEAGRISLDKTRRDFTEGGGELTRTLNSQVTRLLDSCGAFGDRLDRSFGLREADGGARAARSSNQDFASKASLTVFAGMVTGLTVFLIQPDPIGTVDLSADALVVTAVMAQAAANKNATRQDAAERFKGMAATSMVMCLALGADRLSKLSAAMPNGLIQASPVAPYYAALAMTAMAMILPGPIARGAELGLNYAGSKITALFSDPQGNQLATVIPHSLEAAAERVEELRDHLSNMSAHELDAYESVAAASIAGSIRRERPENDTAGEEAPTSIRE